MMKLYYYYTVQSMGGVLQSTPFILHGPIIRYLIQSTLMSDKKSMD